MLHDKKIHESSQNSLFDFSAAEIICLFQQTKNSQHANNHILRNDETLNGWYWSGGSKTSKDTWRAEAQSPNPYPFLFNFNFHIKVGFNAKLIISIVIPDDEPIVLTIKNLKSSEENLWLKSNNKYDCESSFDRLTVSIFLILLSHMLEIISGKQYENRLFINLFWKCFKFLESKKNSEWILSWKNRYEFLAKLMLYQWWTNFLFPERI